MTIDIIDRAVIPYKQAWAEQQEHFDRLLADSTAHGILMLCEHPHVYTLGRSGRQSNLLIDPTTLESIDAEYYHTDRGGDITYHGYGQLVGYPILNLSQAHVSLREYIYILEQSVIETLVRWNITAAREDGATGVWIDSRRKICAIGVRASRHVTMHGMALNVNTDLDYFRHINPCGFTDKGVTSMRAELGVDSVDLEMVKQEFASNFIRLITTGSHQNLETV